MQPCCRLCLTSQASLESVYETRNHNLIADLIKIICPISIDRNESNLSSLICEDCLEIVLSAVDLRVMSVKNDRKHRAIVHIFENAGRKESDNDLSETAENDNIQKESVDKKNSIRKKRKLDDDEIYKHSSWHSYSHQRSESNQNSEDDTACAEAMVETTINLDSSDEDDLNEASNQEERVKNDTRKRKSGKPLTTIDNEAKLEEPKLQISQYLENSFRRSFKTSSTTFGKCKACKQDVRWSRERLLVHKRSCVDASEEEKAFFGNTGQSSKNERTYGSFDMSHYLQGFHKLGNSSYGFCMVCEAKLRWSRKSCAVHYKNVHNMSFLSDFDRFY